jgi:hypothetical protein
MKHSLLRIFLLICLFALAIYGCDRAHNRINGWLLNAELLNIQAKPIASSGLS